MFSCIIVSPFLVCTLRISHVRRVERQPGPSARFQTSDTLYGTTTATVVFI
jgi:hypothetical protein